MSSDLERIARVICQSGRIECGEGCCSFRCMELAGVARDRCPHILKVHGKLATEIIEALYEPSDAMLANTVDTFGNVRIIEFTTPDERSQPFLMAKSIWRSMIKSILRDRENSTK